MKLLRNFLLDSSSVSLILSNLIVIILAIVQRWEVATVLWVYWMQSLIIGFFNFLRILSLKNFSTENFTINHHPAQPTINTKLFTAFFFAFHYGFFHFIYAIFLASVIAKAPENFLSILIGAIIFLFNHLYSFIHNNAIDEKAKPNIGKIMFSPYTRIIPMHLVIIVGVLLADQALLVLFLILKTATDLLTHTLKHWPKALALV